MYNRYVRNDNGSYARIPQEDTPRAAQRGPQSSPPPRQEAKHQEPPHQEPPREEWREPPRSEFPPQSHQAEQSRGDGLSSFLRHFLDQFHLDHVDTGDLLLLGLLFFLFREDADDELLVALGLLLIL